MTWYTRLWRYITLAHGAGGRETGEIIRELVVKKVPTELWRVSSGSGLDSLDDSALIPVSNNLYLAVTIDNYTVKPIFFPGGDIGLLAASGTINDLLMVGARPVALLDGIVVEEGFSTEDLDRIVSSYVSIAEKEGVAIIGGDFKTMPKGQIDGIVISSTGIGFAEKPIDDRDIRPGDAIIVSSTVGDHGAAILAAQQGVGVDIGIKSDVKPLTSLMIPLLERYRDYIHGAGDPTRGGLAMLVNDWAQKTGTVVVLEEENIPVKPQVREYAEMLGIDPLSLASEGVAVLAVDSSVAEEVLGFIHSLGFREAAIVGRVYKPRIEHHRGKVVLRTITGGSRILEPPSGELVPRIC